MADPATEPKVTTTPAPSGTAEQNPTPAGAVNPTTTPELSEEQFEELLKSKPWFAKRLERERENAKKDFEALQAEQKRQAELTAEQKAQELEKKLADQAKEFASKEARLERKSKLLKDVSNADRVLALIELEGKTDEFFDGIEPKLEAILKAFPEYAATRTPGVEPSAGAGGKLPAKLTREAVKKMTTKEINERWEEVQEALKG